MHFDFAKCSEKKQNRFCLNQNTIKIKSSYIDKCNIAKLSKCRVRVSLQLYDFYLSLAVFFPALSILCK